MKIVVDVLIETVHNSLSPLRETGWGEQVSFLNYFAYMEKKLLTFQTKEYITPPRRPGKPDGREGKLL